MNLFLIHSFLPKAMRMVRRHRNMNGGGLLLYVNENISGSQYTLTVFQRKIKSLDLNLVFLIKSGCFQASTNRQVKNLSSLFNPLTTSVLHLIETSQLICRARVKFQANVISHLQSLENIIEAFTLHIFNFCHATEEEIKKEMLNLSPKKVIRIGDIPVKS